jgi:hypothetical protein
MKNLPCPAHQSKSTFTRTLTRARFPEHTTSLPPTAFPFRTDTGLGQQPMCQWRHRHAGLGQITHGSGADGAIGMLGTEGGCRRHEASRREPGRGRVPLTRSLATGSWAVDGVLGGGRGAADAKLGRNRGRGAADAKLGRNRGRGAADSKPGRRRGRQPGAGAVGRWRGGRGLSRGREPLLVLINAIRAGGRL